MKTVVSIQARLGSTRLPGKVLMHLGPKRILEWVVHRCENATAPDQVVLAVGDRPENEAAVELAKRNQWRYIVGPEDDLLTRHRKVAHETGADAVVRVTADCPFLPPSEIERVLDQHVEEGNRYTTNVRESMPTGIAVDVLQNDLLDDLADAAETHPVKLPRERPEEWGTGYSVDDSWRPFGSAHIAVDTPVDYWTLTDAYEAVGDEPKAVAEWVASNK